MPKKLKRCVKKVQDTGKSESESWAICVDSTGLKPHKKKKAETIQNLITLASKLDEQGLHQEATAIDNILREQIKVARTEEVGDLYKDLERFVLTQYPELVKKWNKELEAHGESPFKTFDEAQVDDYSILNAYINETGYSTSNDPNYSNLIKIWDQIFARHPEIKQQRYDTQPEKDVEAIRDFEEVSNEIYGDTSFVPKSGIKSPVEDWDDATDYFIEDWWVFLKDYMLSKYIRGQEPLPTDEEMFQYIEKERTNLSTLWDKYQEQVSSDFDALEESVNGPQIMKVFKNIMFPHSLRLGNQYMDGFKKYLLEVLSREREEKQPEKKIPQSHETISEPMPGEVPSADELEKWLKANKRINSLITLANKLDESGFSKEAGLLDSTLEKEAQWQWMKEKGQKMKDWFKTETF